MKPLNNRTRTPKKAVYVSALFLLLAAGRCVGADWEGTDDFCSGISPAKWKVVQMSHGQMTVVGTDCHASFLDSTSTTTAEQNAYILWNGTPTAADDWMVDISGHNSAPYSDNGGSQLQLAVAETASLATSLLGYRISLDASGPEIDVAQWSNGLTLTRAAISTTTTDCQLRLVYHAASQQIEAWYKDPTVPGSGWTRLDTINLAQFAPGMRASSTFTFGILSDTYYGPLSEGDIWAGNFNAGLPAGAPCSVTTKSSPAGAGTTGGAGTYTNGQIVTVAATPSGCFDFVKWTTTGSTAALSTNSSYQFTITNTEALVANFVLKTGAIVTLSNPAKGGTTTGGGVKNCGAKVTVMATAATGYLFMDWSVNGSTVSTLASYSFTNEGAEMLTANFLTNPFPAIQGTYNGLFFQTNASSSVIEQSSGFATITIAATSKGAYSAVLKVDGGSYSFSGMFDLNGSSVTNITRKGKSPLTLTLHIELNLSPPADSMTGSVEAADWAGPSGLQADLAYFNGTTRKASNYAGKYTFVLPSSETPATSPGGYSVAEFANNLAGNAVLTGSLADNTTITSLSTPISKEGFVPIYYAYTPGTNILFGWLKFTNVPPQTVAGDLTWFKLSTKSKVLYSAGFTNQTNIIGSLYAPVTSKTLVTNGTLAIVDPGQGIDLVYTNVCIISNKLTYAKTTTNQLTANITSTTGAISLSFRPSGAKANLTAQGVVLQNSPTDPSIKAAGWFLGTNQTGYFILTP